MPDNEIVPIEPEQPLAEVQHDDDPKSVASKCEQAERDSEYGLATFAEEIWLRDKKTGKWSIETGMVARRLLHVFRANPTKSGLVDGLKIHTAVDPNRTGEHIYFIRNPGERWMPLVPETFEVMTRTGIYNVRDKVFMPYEEKSIVFGPLIDVVIDQGVLDKVRVHDFSTAPTRVQEILHGISQAIGDPPTMRYFQQVIGQILRPHCGFNSFVHVFGESGSRKTTLLRTLLTAPCGIHGCSEISEQLLAERYFSRAGLANKIANLSNDSALSRNFVSFIKEVTSGVLQVEKKFCDTIRLPLTAKLISTMNVAQNYEDVSLGVENRLIAFKFKPRQGNNRSAEGCRWADPNFYDETDRQWFCSWLIVGLESLFVDGVENMPKPSSLASEWKEELLNASNPIRTFVSSNILQEVGVQTPVSALVDRAIEAGDCGTSEFARGEFSSKLGRFLHARWGVERKLVRVGGDRKYCYKGIKLKEIEEQG